MTSPCRTTVTLVEGHLGEVDRVSMLLSSHSHQGSDTAVTVADEAAGRTGHSHQPSCPIRCKGRPSGVHEAGSEGQGGHPAHCLGGLRRVPGCSEARPRTLNASGKGSSLPSALLYLPSPFRASFYPPSLPPFLSASLSLKVDYVTKNIRGVPRTHFGRHYTIHEV